MVEDGDSSQGASHHGAQYLGGPALTMSGRTIQACDRCRFKKVRCDGAVPTCGRCKGAGLECLTTVKLNRKSYPRSYTESIEERLRQLEAEVHQLREGNDAKDRRIKELEMANARVAAPRQSNFPPPGSTPLPAPRHDGLRPGLKASTDEPLSREVGRMNFDRRGTGRFMGSSSGIFFVGTASQKLASLGKLSGKVGDALLRVDIDDQTTEYALQSYVENSETSVVLPPRGTAETHIGTWFDCSKQIFPILHRASFMEAVDGLYAASVEGCDRAFLAQFFLVLALGCRHAVITGRANQDMPSVKSTGEDVDLFCRSTRFQNDILARNDLMTLQWQELLTLWYLYTGKRSLAFQMTGGMTRLALELGLHRHTRRFHFDPLMTEMRKRTFWVCYMLDSFVSAIDGLPKSFRDHDLDVELPSDVDDDFVNPREYLLSLPGEPTGMVLFQSLAKVVQILSKTLEILYTTTDRRQTLTKIKTVDQLLDQWIHTLPDHLQLDPAVVLQPPSDDIRIEPNIAFLHLTYLYARFSAHRVAVSFQPTAPQYRPELRRCFEIAKDLIYLNCHSQRHLLAFDVNPGSHVYTLWSCGLMSLFGFWEAKIAGQPTLTLDDEKSSKVVALTCVELLKAFVAAGRGGEQVRVDNLMEIIIATWPDNMVSVTETTDPHPVTPGLWPSQSLQQAINGPSPDQPTPFTQLLQSMYVDVNGAPTTRRGSAPSQAQSQSPRLSHLEMPVPSPSLLEGFNIDFSSAFSQACGDFHPMPATGNPDNQGSAISLASHQRESIQQIWDDPIFNLASTMPANSPPFAIGEDMNGPSARDDQQSRKRPRLDPSF